MLSKNFHHSFWLLYRNIFRATSFLRICLAGYLFYLKLFLMDWIRRSFTISSFISNRSQLFSRMNVHRKLRQIQRITPRLDPQSKTVIRKETPAQVYTCEFWKSFKNTFFIKKLRVSSILTLVRISISCALFNNLCYLSKNLPSSINMVPLESDRQVEHYFVLFLLKETNEVENWQ